MAFRKHVMFTVVLLGISGLLLGCSSDDTVTLPITTDAPLIAPSNVTATRMANGDIELAWDSITQANLKGYHVYRHAVELQEIGKLTSIPIATNSFTDTSAEDRVLYEYRVTAVSTKNVETGYSSVAIFSLPPTGGKGDGEFEE